MPQVGVESVMEPTDCQECDRLWRVYVNAIRQHVESVDAGVEATKTDDIARMKALQTALQGAVERRELARSQLKSHEATHGEAGAAKKG